MMKKWKNLDINILGQWYECQTDINMVWLSNISNMYNYLEASGESNPHNNHQY